MVLHLLVRRRLLRAELGRWWWLRPLVLMLLWLALVIPLKLERNGNSSAAEFLPEAVVVPLLLSRGPSSERGRAGPGMPRPP